LKPLLVACLFFLSLPGLLAQTAEACPSGQEDMLNYFTMGYPNRLNNYMGPGNANPIYTDISPDLGENFATSGKFFWTKSSIGYPWDIKKFDKSYVYDRTTELSWTDPTSFKRFNTDMRISARCVPVNGSGGKLWIPHSQTDYTFYANCNPTKTQNLGYVMNTISAPATVDAGGTLGTIKTRYFTYTYSCNSSYANCAYKEVFSLGYGVGLYDWKYYVNQNGSFVLQQESVINRLASGSATPYTPCTSSYE
jgi:hypothetical protein